MPTYEYLCPQGHEFEEFQSITAEPVAPCPECGTQARRQISAGVGLIFKGSGFYITDYKNKGQSRAGESSGEKAKTSESGGKTSASSDSASNASGGGKTSSGKTSKQSAAA